MYQFVLYPKRKLSMSYKPMFWVCFVIEISFRCPATHSKILRIHALYKFILPQLILRYSFSSRNCENCSKSVKNVKSLSEVLGMSLIYSTFIKYGNAPLQYQFMIFGGKVQTGLFYLLFVSNNLFLPDMTPSVFLMKGYIFI